MNRNKLKANALDATANIILIVATLAAGLAVYQLLSNAARAIAVVTSIAVAFGVDSFLRPMLADTFGPHVDRLRGLEPKGAEQR